MARQPLSSAQKKKVGHMLSHVGLQLMVARQARRLTQVDFARRCTPSVTAVQVSRWENGISDVPVSRLANWAEVLDVEPAYFVGPGDPVLVRQALPEEERAETLRVLGRIGREAGDGVDVDEPAQAVGSYDPDEVGVPPALQLMREMGVAVREDELAWMVGLLDPKQPQAAHGAADWTPGDWLDHVIDRRRAAGK